MKKLILLALLLSLALPAEAKKTAHMVELSWCMRVIKVGEIHMDEKYHVLKIICFLDKGRRLVYEDLTTDEYRVQSSYKFAKRTDYLGVDLTDGVASWSSSHREQEL